MLQPGRKYTNGSGYRYGFNGKENDNEVKGEGNQQDYGMRIYDTRLGKFLSVDPLSDEFPWYTPYQFAGNKPTIAIDLDGEEEKTVTHHLARYADGDYYIKSIDVAIDHNVRFLNYSSDGKITEKAITNIYVEYGGETSLVGFSEENVIAGGMKPSAKYDYTDDKVSMRQKNADDEDYAGWNLIKWLEVTKRDRNAPDNAMVVEDLQTLGATLAAAAAATTALKQLQQSRVPSQSSTKPPATANSKNSKQVVDTKQKTTAAEPKLSKVQKSKKTESIGGKYTKTTKTTPGKGPGQSRSEMIFYKNKDGKLIKSRKNSYDRGNKLQNTKPVRGGPEGRPAGG